MPGSVDRSVAGGEPDVAPRVDLGSRAPHPHRPLVVSGRRIDLIGGDRPAGLGDRHHPPVVGGAVPVVAAEAEDDPTRVERQRHPLQGGRGVDARRVDPLAQLDGPRGQPEPDQFVRRAVPARHVGDHEDLASCRVDGRGGSDPDGRGDVPAREGRRGDRGPHMGRPADLPVGRVQRIDGVVLGRDDDSGAGHQGFPVELPVEGTRNPDPVRPGQADRSGDAVTFGIVVVQRPVGRCRGPGRRPGHPGEAERDQGNPHQGQASGPPWDTPLRHPAIFPGRPGSPASPGRLAARPPHLYR